MKVIHKSALFSPCRTWRYLLTRLWDMTLPRAMFIGLNCSTADETQDDPTVRRCQGYAREWGFGGLVMTNLFAFRATDPQVMKAAADPVGSANDFWLLETAQEAGIIIAAWGNHGLYRSRGKEVIRILLGTKELKPIYCLGLTKLGEPKHPLYLPKNLNPIQLLGKSSISFD